MTLWISVPSQPALRAFWHVEDEASIMRHAAPIKQCCVDELKQGRNVREKVGETLDTRPWEGNRHPAQAKLDTLQRKANSGSKGAIMRTYADDCQIDGNRSLGWVLWASLRLHFESDDFCRDTHLLGTGKVGLFHQLESWVEVHVPAFTV